MSDDKQAYVDMVSVYVRNQNDSSLRGWLFAEENIDATHEALIHLKRDVERQFSYQKSKNIQVRTECMTEERSAGLKRWQEHQKEYADWKVKVSRFLIAIEDCLAETRAAKRDRHRGHHELDARDFIDAIKKHKKSITEDEGSSIDWDLWRVLEEAEEREVVDTR